MILSMKTPDIKQAVYEFITSRGIITENARPTMNIVKLRSGDELLIEIDIGSFASPTTAKEYKLEEATNQVDDSPEDTIENAPETPSSSTPGPFDNLAK